MRITGSLLIVVVASVLSASPLHAQSPAASAAPPTAPRAARPGEVESDPIRCWWKADRTSVRVGETFTLVLTCSVIEAGSITVVPVLNQLDPGALSLTPFEVVRGVAHDDVVVPPWRYIQREYSVRLLSDGFFGQDVMIPAQTVSYNLVEKGTGSQGRDQQYILPALPMRVLSLVPRGADDIRDASGQTFASIESRRFRASLATTTAWVSFAFALVFGAFALVRATGQLRTGKQAAVRPLPASSVLGASLSALARVKQEASQSGWTADLSRRAAVALRIAAAVALGRPVSQQVVGRDVAEREGQLRACSGWLRRRRVLLSAATTPLSITTAMNNGNQPDAQTRVHLAAISEALARMSAAGYGRQEQGDAAALDSALEESTQAVRRIRAGTRWPRRTAHALRSFVGS